MSAVGFIGLVSFAVVKAGVAKHLSTHIFTPATESPEQWKELAHCAEGELGEIIEDMHMSLFGECCSAYHTGKHPSSNSLAHMQQA